MTRSRVNIGEIFYFVTPDCKFEPCYDNRQGFENKLYEAGNYFRSAEDATIAALNFKAMLNSNTQSNFIHNAEIQDDEVTKPDNFFKKITNRLGLLHKV